METKEKLPFAYKVEALAEGFADPRAVKTLQSGRGISNEFIMLASNDSLRSFAKHGIRFVASLVASKRLDEYLDDKRKRLALFFAAQYELHVNEEQLFKLNTGINEELDLQSLQILLREIGDLRVLQAKLQHRANPTLPGKKR